MKMGCAWLCVSCAHQTSPDILLALKNQFCRHIRASRVETSCSEEVAGLKRMSQGSRVVPGTVHSSSCGIYIWRQCRSKSYEGCDSTYFQAGAETGFDLTGKAGVLTFVPKLCKRACGGGGLHERERGAKVVDFRMPKERWSLQLCCMRS